MKLEKIVAKKKKRLGRGYGSGKGGHTASRGQKGQKSRRKIGVLFEGVKVRKSLLKRTPQLRGKDKFKSSPKPVILNLTDLNKLRSLAVVDIETLKKHNLVNEKEAQKRGVKVLGSGKITKKLNVKIPVSASAAKKIKRAGGKVENG